MFEKEMIKEFDGKSSKELLKAPIYAISGVSEGDAQKMKEAFGIDNIRELSALSYYRHAKEIAKYAAEEDETK